MLQGTLDIQCATHFCPRYHNVYLLCRRQSHFLLKCCRFCWVAGSARIGFYRGSFSPWFCDRMKSKSLLLLREGPV